MTMCYSLDYSIVCEGRGVYIAGDNTCTSIIPSCLRSLSGVLTAEKLRGTPSYPFPKQVVFVFGNDHRGKDSFHSRRRDLLHMV